jgi:hypothetical protein
LFSTFRAQPERLYSRTALLLTLILGEITFPFRAVLMQNGRQSNQQPANPNARSKTMPPPQQSTEQHPARSSRTLRLTFSYEGGTVRLVSRMSVDMIAPAASPTPIREGQSGFWYELRDRSGRVLYQRALHNPIRIESEVYPVDQTQPIRHVPVNRPRGNFDLLVPDMAEADNVILFSSPLDPANSAAPARELARFRLKEEPK